MLTPEDIRERRFLVTVPGYDLDEVHTFLEDVAAHVEDGPTVPRAERYADIAAAAKQVLEAADAAAAELRAHGERDADRMESEALARAAAITREAEQSVQAKLDEAQSVLAQAEAKQRDADRKLETLALEREEFEHEQQAAAAAIRRAGEDAQAILRDAARPREALLSAIEQVRAMLGDGFAGATQDVDAVYEETQALARNLEGSLGVDPGEPGTTPAPDVPGGQPAEPEGADPAAADAEGSDPESSDPESSDPESSAPDDDAGGTVAQSGDDETPTGDATAQDEAEATDEAAAQADARPEASDDGDDVEPDVRRDPHGPPEDDAAFYSALASRIRETTGGMQR